MTITSTGGINRAFIVISFSLKSKSIDNSEKVKLLSVHFLISVRLL